MPNIRVTQKEAIKTCRELGLVLNINRGWEEVTLRKNGETFGSWDLKGIDYSEVVTFAYHLHLVDQVDPVNPVLSPEFETLPSYVDLYHTVIAIARKLGFTLEVCWITFGTLSALRLLRHGNLLALWHDALNFTTQDYIELLECVYEFARSTKETE